MIELQSTPGEKISSWTLMDGSVTRDFPKIMAKKRLFSRFFGAGGTFLGSRGQITYPKKKFSKK